jgi:hypothetical protein
MCQETLDHLAFVNGKVKDVEGFWLSTLVRLLFVAEVLVSGAGEGTDD